MSTLVWPESAEQMTKRIDLFTYYLKVIEALKPKYFVMENVEGILTKDEGRIKERICAILRTLLTMIIWALYTIL